MREDGANGETVLADFAKAGVDIQALAVQLQLEGAQCFTKSCTDLMAVIASKSEQLHHHGSTGG